jgi:signal transduction histidine kinase
LVRNSGHDVSLDLGGVAGRSWPDAVERAAYRTVQEALTNVGKHAPGAPVTVTVESVGRALRVTVRNVPPPGTRPYSGPAGGGHGLVGLRERAEQLGGSFRAGRTAEGGFTVEAVFPAQPDPGPVGSTGIRSEAPSERPAR